MNIAKSVTTGPSGTYRVPFLIIAATLLSPGAYFVNNNNSVNGLTDISNKCYFDKIEGMNFDGNTGAFDPSLEWVQDVK